MKKIINYFGILALTASTGFASYAKSVNETTAKTVGSNFLISRDVAGVSSAADLTTSYVATAQVNGVVINDFYAFNINGAKGFVIVTADDNIIPILAYSTESSFDITTMNPSAKDWIEGYQNQISAAISNNLPAQAGTSESWSELMVTGAAKHLAARKTTATFPLLGTLAWDQAPGYNNYCPGGSVTGCVATAMSQVMKYWNWPAVGSGSHTYTQSPNASGYAAQTADFGNTAYNWTQMQKNLTTSCEATDSLMHHAGIGVNMNYSPTESGAYVISDETEVVNCSEYALKNYFHFKRSTVRGIPRSGEALGSYYSSGFPYDPYIAPSSTWDATIQAELDASRPVLYSGAGSDGGHNWVCDGYEAGPKYHFNFGWSGNSDGYYTTTNVAPPALGLGGGGPGNNFNKDQCIIIGIEPDSFPVLSSGTLQMASHLDIAANSPMAYPPVFTTTAKITNTSSTAFAGDICVQVYDTLFNLIDTVQVLPKQSIAAGATGSFSVATLPTLPGHVMNAMIPAPYNIRIMYRATGSKTWTPVNNNGVFYNENLIVVQNTTYSSINTADTGVELADSIAIAGGSKTIKSKSTLSFTTKIGNYTSGLFNGNVQAVLTNVVTGTAYPVQSPVSIAISYSSTTLPMTFTGTVAAPVGIYTLSVQHQPGSTGAYYVTGTDFFQNPVLVNVIAATGVITPSAIADNINVYPNPATNEINIAMNGVSVDQIRITNIMGREISNMVPGSQSVVTIPLSNYAAGIYFVNLYSGEEVVTKKIVVTK